MSWNEPLITETEAPFNKNTERDTQIPIGIFPVIASLVYAVRIINRSFYYQMIVLTSKTNEAIMVKATISDTVNGTP